MLYIFYGNDTVTSREKARVLIERLRGDERGFFERVSADTFDSNSLDARIEEIGLFSGDMVTVLDGILSAPGAEEMLENRAKDFALSPNAFVLIDEKLPKKIIDECEECGAQVTHSEKAKRGKEWEDRPVFSFVDAYAKGDKKSAWALLEKLRAEGVREEEIIGTLFWRIKTMILAKTHDSAEGASMKPFVYGSARRLASGYVKEELQKRLEDIVILRHETWRNSSDIGIALEQFVLGGERKGK